MYRLFFIFCICFMGSMGWSSELCDELAAIDQRIEALTQRQNLHRARASSYDDEGMRWQFRSGQMVEARRSFALAELERIKMAEAEVEIYELEQRKEQLLKSKP